MTQGFLALDDEQRAVADAVRGAQELNPGGRLEQDWAAVAAVGDAATNAYLTATQEHPLDGSRPIRDAREADEQALREVERAREAIRRFRAAHSRTLDEAESVLRNLPRTVQETRTAIGTARTAVQDAAASGVRSQRAEDRLVEAEQAAAALDAADVGLRERRRAAHRALELARSAATLASEAPRTAQQVRSALGSIATRRSAALTKAERIEPAMSALRREFSEPCSRDLTGVETAVRAAITDADNALADAEQLAASGDWDAAADQVTAARSALSRAEERYETVDERLTGLRDVRADPAKQAGDTRFVLRDAQRLVVDRDLVGEFGPILDAQSVRLANAQERLSGVHPDYWLYLTELRGIRERVREVVATVRARS